MRFPSLLPVVFLFLGLLAAEPCRAEPVSFRRQVAPILLSQCQGCHGPKKAEGGYRLDSFARAIGEGDSGSRGFDAGKLDSSEAFRRITSDDQAERMPLDGDPLPAEQIALVKQWIAEGTKFDGSDEAAPLASIVPPPTHPEPPEVYPTPVPITAVAFSPDGQELLVGGYHEITVWDPDDGKLLRRLKNIGQRTYALAFSPDGKTLAVACGAPGRLGEVRLVDPASGQVARVIATAADVMLDVAFSPQGDKLACGGADNTARIIDLASGQTERTLQSHSDWVTAVAFSPDGAKLATASRDKTAKVFDTASGELLMTYSGHGEAVRGVAFAAEGQQVFSSGADRKIHLWKVSDGKKTADVGSFGGEVHKLTLDGDVLLAGSADKSVRRFSAKDKKEVGKLEGHQDWVYAAAYDPQTDRIASGSFDGQVRVCSAADGSTIAAFLAAPGYERK